MNECSFLTLLHAAAAILLAIYGANSPLLTVFYLRRRPENQTEPSPPWWPAVLWLPVFSELHDRAAAGGRDAPGGIRA